MERIGIIEIPSQRWQRWAQPLDHIRKTGATDRNRTDFISLEG